MKREPGFYINIGAERGPCRDGLVRVSAAAWSSEVLQAFRSAFGDPKGIPLVAIDGDGKRHEVTALIESIEEGIFKSFGYAWAVGAILPARASRKEPVRIEFPSADLPRRELREVWIEPPDLSGVETVAETAR